MARASPRSATWSVTRRSTRSNSIDDDDDDGDGDDDDKSNDDDTTISPPDVWQGLHPDQPPEVSPGGAPGVHTLMMMMVWW